MFLSFAATQNEIFRTETVKRSLNPIFGKTLQSENLPKCLLKDGCLKLRVMDEERYANDVCLGEVSIPLKKIAPFEEKEKEQETEEQTFVTEAICEKDSVPAIRVSTNKGMAQLSTYTLFPMREVSEPSTT